MENPVQFVKEATGELKKSSWLTRPQAVGSTIVVCVLVMLTAVYVAGVDFVLSIVMSAIIGR